MSAEPPERGGRGAQSRPPSWRPRSPQRDVAPHPAKAMAPLRLPKRAGAALAPAGQVFEETADDIAEDAQISSAPRPLVSASPDTTAGSSSRTSAAGSRSSPEDARTTVILQRIPDTLDADTVRTVLGAMDLADAVDALAVPMRSTRPRRNASYAFVNFTTPEDAERCIRQCTGRPFGNADPTRVCVAEYAHTQGAAHVLSRAEGRAQRSSRGKRGGETV